MRVLVLIGLGLTLLGCRPRTDDPEDFLNRYLTRQNGNEVVRTRNGITYRLHWLNGEYFAAREAAAVPVNASFEKTESIEARNRYSQGLHFLLRMEPSVGSGQLPISQAEFADLIRCARTYQDQIAERGRLHSKDGKAHGGAVAVVNGIFAARPVCELLFTFPVPESSIRDWTTLTLSGMSDFPLDFDFPLLALRPKLRFEP